MKSTKKDHYCPKYFRKTTR